VKSLSKKTLARRFEIAYNAAFARLANEITFPIQDLGRMRAYTAARADDLGLEPALLEAIEIFRVK